MTSWFKKLIHVTTCSKFPCDVLIHFLYAHCIIAALYFSQILQRHVEFICENVFILFSKLQQCLNIVQQVTAITSNHPLLCINCWCHKSNIRLSLIFLQMNPVTHGFQKKLAIRLMVSLPNGSHKEPLPLRLIILQLASSFQLDSPKLVLQQNRKTVKEGWCMTRTNLFHKLNVTCTNKNNQIYCTAALSYLTSIEYITRDINNSIQHCWIYSCISPRSHN